jgi:hypothetical protein
VPGLTRHERIVKRCPGKHRFPLEHVQVPLGTRGNAEDLYEHFVRLQRRQVNFFPYRPMRRFELENVYPCGKRRHGITNPE